MTRIVAFITTPFVTGLLVGCVPAASDQEISQMCENLVKLRGEVDLTPLDQRLAKIDEDLAARKADLEKRLADAVAAAANETQARIAELGDAATAEQKAGIEKDGAARKAEAETRHAEALAQLEPDRATRIEEAKQKAKDAEAEAAGRVEDCARKAKEEGVTQPLAKCRAEADTVDTYWNRCR